MNGSTHTAASPTTVRPAIDLTPAFVAGQSLYQLRQAMLTTPGRLRLALGGIWASCALMLLAAFVGIEYHRHEMQTVGKDAAPSIIAAQAIRASLTDMQINVVRQLLGGDDAGVAAGDTFEHRRWAATTSLITAAENITYGDAERAPIQKLLFGMGNFDREVARVRSLHDRRDLGYLASLRETERILHEDLLPAADALDKANLEALENGYITEQRSSAATTAAFIVMGLMVLGVLAAAQVFLVRQTRRFLNPPLCLASLGTAWLLVSLVGGFRAESHDLKVAKEDCFDSIHLLSRARGYAYDARVFQLQRLADQQRADTLDKRFAANAARVISLSEGTTLASIVNEIDMGGTGRFSGCLADELNNITFPGERDAVTDAIRGYVGYLISSEAVTRLAAAGDSRGVELAIGDSPATPIGVALAAVGSLRPQGCGYVFARFDAALEQALAINQVEFDAAIDRGMKEMQGRSAISSIVLAAVAILGYLGLRPRLKEYIV